MTKLLDPVCGMTVDGDTALRAAGHTDVAFCAPGCRTSFLKDPDSYPARLDDADPEQKQCTCANHEGHEGHSQQTTSEPVAGESGCCGGHGG